MEAPVGTVQTGTSTEEAGHKSAQSRQGRRTWSLGGLQRNLPAGTSRRRVRDVANCSVPRGSGDGKNGSDVDEGPAAT